MVYGLIICAGKQSRFKSQTPKALVTVKGKTLLQRNIEAMSKECDKIYVVCSNQNQHYFDYKNKIFFESGKGSGDAVWQALERLNIKKGDFCYVLWGDALTTPEIYTQIKNAYKKDGVIPCVYESNPYVQIIPKENGGVSAKFSKFNEKTTAGYHDLSLFYFDADVLLKKLRDFRNKITDKNGNYCHKHGNEMELLDVFNETNIKPDILEIKHYKDFSFNTVEQLKDLLEKQDVIEK